MKSWKDITIRKFYEITDIVSVQDEYTALNLIDCIYGVDSSEISIVDMPKYDISFISKELPTCEMTDKMTLNGHVYDVDCKLTNVKANQFVDFSNYMSNGKAKYEDILSVFIVPEGHKYNDGYDLDDVKNDILEMDMVMCNTIARFFFLQYRLFIETFRVYLIKGVKKMKLPKKEKKELIERLEHLDFQSLESYLTL